MKTEIFILIIFLLVILYGLQNKKDSEIEEVKTIVEDIEDDKIEEIIVNNQNRKLELEDYFQIIIILLLTAILFILLFQLITFDQFNLQEYFDKNLKGKLELFKKLKIDALYSNMDSTEDAFGWFQTKTTTDNFIQYFQRFFYYLIQREGTNIFLPNNVFKFSFLDENNNISNYQDRLTDTAIDNYIFPDTLEYLFFDAAQHTLAQGNEGQTNVAQDYRIELDAQRIIPITINQRNTYGLFAVLLGGDRTMYSHYVALIHHHNGWHLHDDDRVVSIGNIENLFSQKNILKLKPRAYVYVKDLERKLDNIGKGAKLKTPRNLGNTCYMYSMVKILLFLPDFRNKVVNYLNHDINTTTTDQLETNEENNWLRYYLQLYDLYFPNNQEQNS